MAKRVKVSIDASSLQDLLTEFGEAFNARTADAIGTQVTIKMKDLIGKGISPIEKHGRFPPYKAQTIGKEIAEKKKSLREKIKDTVSQKKIGIESLRQQLKNTKGKGSTARKQAIRAKITDLKLDVYAEKRVGAANRENLDKQRQRKRYPDSVQEEFPNKKRRPVNLELSGKFLDNLDYWKVGLRERFEVAIGFRRAPYVDYERGHREQANGQGFRPIIPQDEETFVKQIKLIIDGIFKDAVELYLNKRR